MKFAYSDINQVFQWNQPLIPTLIIENQSLFRKFLKDLYLSLDGVPTPAVLSQRDKPVDFGKFAEIITDFFISTSAKNPLSIKSAPL